MGTRSGFNEPPGELAPPPRSAFREYAETIIICVLFIVFARAFVFQQSEIPSGSMEDTILVGDYVLVNRFLYAPTSFAWERALLPRRELQRGDVIVFKHPQTPEQDYIKRVIGLPGETVELRRGRLFVDGLPIEEPYLNALYRDADPTQDWGPRTVSSGQYLFMGDHRNRSSDGRRWGFVPHELIKGRAFMVLFSTEGASNAGGQPGQVTATSLVRKLFNLVFRARWDRFLTAVR